MFNLLEVALGQVYVVSVDSGSLEFELFYVVLIHMCSLNRSKCSCCNTLLLVVSVVPVVLGRLRCVGRLGCSGFFKMCQGVVVFHFVLMCLGCLL